MKRIRPLLSALVLTGTLGLGASPLWAVGIETEDETWVKATLSEQDKIIADTPDFSKPSASDSLAKENIKGQEVDLASEFVNAG